MMSREQMIKEVVKVNGTDSKFTTWFCDMVEDKSVTDETLLCAMITLVSMNVK